MKKTVIICLLGVMIGIPMNAESAVCAGGAGEEYKGNSYGTYCRSRIGMNLWSAHAWCNAIGMKLISVDECACSDETKCDLTVTCPNLYNPSASFDGAWTSTPATYTGYAHAISVREGNIVVHAATHIPEWHAALCGPH